MTKTATCYSANCIGWLSLCIFQIDHAGFVGIDDGSVAVLALLRDTMVIGEVDMPVGKQARMVLVKQGVEALKAPVRDGLEVVEMARGRIWRAGAWVSNTSKPPCSLRLNQRLRTRRFI